MPKKRSPSILKRIRQNRKRRLERRPVKTITKTLFKKAQTLAKSGQQEELKKILPLVFKSIDLAAKKHMIHWKNAARKKSQLAKLLAEKS